MAMVLICGTAVQICDILPRYGLTQQSAKWKAVGSLAPVLRCLEAALQLPQVCNPKLIGKRFDGCHSVFAANLNRIGILFEETCSREINCLLP